MGQNFADDVGVSGQLSSAIRVAGPQLADALESNQFIPQSHTVEWIDFDPSSVGLNRARGSMAIEVDTNPPVVWLKVSPGGANQFDWTALATGATPEPATSIEWEAVNNLGAPPGSPVANTSGGSAAIQLTNASALQTSQCVGLYVAGTTVMQAGLFTQTVTEWNAVVTGASTGLTPGAAYWLDTVAGKLTSTPPSGTGNFDTFVGYALSAAELVVMPAPPIGPL
jgi:hypothetical protein